MKATLACVGIALALIVAGSLDFKDEAAAQLLYCDNVARGVWPDYNESFQKECTEEKRKELENILR